MCLILSRRIWERQPVIIRNMNTKGVCDLMRIYEPKQGFRQVADTDRHTKIEFADSMKYLAERYPDALVIRVAQDNLNTA